MMDLDLTNFFAMIAAQHSGTRLLRGCFNSHPGVLCLPEPWSHREILPAEDYYRWFRMAGGDPRVIVVDVKYNQIAGPLEEILRELPVLHLIRRDIEAMYFSGRYHPEERPAPDFDDGEYESVLSYVTGGRERFDYLAELTLFYEELTGGNRNVTTLPAWASACLCAWLGVEQRPLVADTQKLAPTDYKKFWRRP